MGALPPYFPEQGSLSRVDKMSFSSQLFGAEESAAWVSGLSSPASFAVHNGCLNSLSPSPAGFSKTIYLNSFGRLILLSQVHVGAEHDSSLKAELQVWRLNFISMSNPFFSHRPTGRHKWIPACRQTLTSPRDQCVVGTRMLWVQFV